GLSGLAACRSVMGGPPGGGLWVVVGPEPAGGTVKKDGREIMEILQAFDLTGCAHSAAALAGGGPEEGRRLGGLGGRGRAGAGPAGDGPGAAGAADRSVRGQGRGVGGSFPGEGPRGCGA